MCAALACVLSWGVWSARAPARPADAAEPVQAGQGSLARFAGLVATALEDRLRAEGIGGVVRVEAAPSRGIDAARVERVFIPRVKQRMRESGTFPPSSDAPVVCRIALSEERSAFWAIATIEGPALTGPSTVAVSMAVDRELEAALGAVVRPAQTRFVLERLGAVPPGVLDAALIDVDDDTVEEIVLLGVDGVRVFRVGAARLELVGGPYALPERRRWPRVLVGWLASIEPGRVWGVTSAGHGFVLDAKQGRFSAAPSGLVPLRGTSTPQGVLAGTLRPGTPVVSLPLVTSAGASARTPPLPARVRDVAVTADGAWLYVNEHGELFGQRPGASAVSLASERVGDRIAVADLESDREPELVTTAALPAGEGDHIVVRRLTRDLGSSGVVFRSPLSGGSVVALATGHIESSGRTELILIEEVGDEALAWRLRFTP